ncbi:MAG: DUF4831 family protein [Bacteroidales bacterium]|nr:DUF4831 family protein [Bacteroidales bacterium]
MKNFVLYMVAAMIMAGCSTTTRIQVTPLGQEPAEALEKYMYALPQSVLRVEVTYQEANSVPGPYWEYAEKYLGISQVIKQSSSHWNIQDVVLTQHTELDPQHIYSLNLLEGEYSGKFLDHYIEQGILVDGTAMIHEQMKGPALESDFKRDYLRYVDLGVYGNFEKRTETMYKTLVTDTSYVRVPVQRSIVEQKSPLRKAEEAADFVLELRNRRFEMLTGEYEVFPNGEAMAAAIEKLDQLEESYLTLFTGKTISRMGKRAYFIVPETGSSPSRYRLDMFSSQLGFVPAELMEGEPLEVQIEPLGTINALDGQVSGTPEEKGYDKLYYRLPDVVELKVNLGVDVLFSQRISIFQSGAVITSPIK